MKTLLSLIAILSTALIAQSASADNGYTDSQMVEQEIEILDANMFAGWGNPPGSRWISVRCGTNSVCYPPAGYKFRHFNTDIKGSDCKGAQKRRVKQTKDFIKTSRKCSVRGRVFVWPAEYCKGNYKYCS